MEAIVTGLILSAAVAAVSWVYAYTVGARNERQDYDIRRLVAENSQLKFILACTRKDLEEKTRRRPPPPPSDEDFNRGRQVGRLDATLWLCRNFQHDAEALVLSACDAVRDMNKGTLEP